MKSIMQKVRHAFFTLSTLTLLGWALPASAQWVVFDPANFSQNVLTAARTLAQIENQIQQLQNEAQMLSNEGRNLESLNFSSLSQLEATLANTQRLLNQTQSLTFRLSSVQQTFARLYPASYGSAATSSQINADALTRWSDSRQALSTTLQMQAQANQNFPSDESVLADLVNSSQSAAGALQATQATNQLLALQTRELIQAQQLGIAQDRAVALEAARAVEADEQARSLRQRFMSATTSYTPQTIQVF